LLASVLLAFESAPNAESHTGNKNIPSNSSKLESWIKHNIKEFHERKARISQGTRRPVLDQVLVRAEDDAQVIKVKKDGSGDFTTVTDAVESIPSGNNRRMVVWIGGGEYWEKITVNSSRSFVTFFGDPQDMPKIVFNGTAFHYGTVYSATVAVESDYFMAVNVAFVNSAPMPDGKREGAQAVAMRISGDKGAFHNCKFIGFQDTLCDDKGRHFFKDCYIQGTVDFIFGNGKSLYLNTTIHSVAKSVGVITAQARENVTDDSGFAFVYCNITGTGNSNNTYLGRAWKERPKVVFAYTYMGIIINSKGWSDNWHPERDGTVYYGEYKCIGPGASSSGRVKFAKVLSDEEAKPFLNMTYIYGRKWLLPPPKL
ncbi:Pectinesterase domain-containing protein, partial [Cephalotus follicularis]